MAGLHALESPSPASTYEALGPMIDDATGEIACYSRLPARQLLRYIPSNTVTMWWISDHESPQTVSPSPIELQRHLARHMNDTMDMVIIEGLDWLVTRAGPEDTLAMLQALDAQARSTNTDIIFPVDGLSFSSTFWNRLTSLAPKLDLVPAQINGSGLSDSEGFVDLTETVEQPISSVESTKERVLVHLVNLPKVGFNHTLLAKRMLQWKRMGFDLSALEPALVLSDVSQSHAIYESVEADIVLAIDCIRLIEANHGKLSATEREMFNYRMMALNNVSDAAVELETVLSAR